MRGFHAQCATRDRSRKTPCKQRTSIYSTATKTQAQLHQDDITDAPLCPTGDRSPWDLLHRQRNLPLPQLDRYVYTHARPGWYSTRCIYVFIRSNTCNRFQPILSILIALDSQTFGLSFASRQIGNMCRGQLGDSFAYHLDWEATIFSIDLKKKTNAKTLKIDCVQVFE